MSDDDANEGGNGCPGHEWRPVGVHLGRDGAHIDNECVQCGAVMTQTPQTITPMRYSDE